MICVCGWRFQQNVKSVFEEDIIWITGFNNAMFTIKPGVGGSPLQEKLDKCILTLIHSSSLCG